MNTGLFSRGGNDLDSVLILIALLLFAGTIAPTFSMRSARVPVPYVLKLGNKRLTHWRHRCL